MATEYQDLIAACGAHISAGRTDLAAKPLRALNVAQIPRAFRLPLAALSRRAGLNSLGLRILAPIVQLYRAKLPDSTSSAQVDQEITEYALLLMRNGSVQEALDMLRPIDGTRVPEALLYTAYCHVTSWNYERAIPMYEDYLASGPSPFSALVARLNLSAAYLATSDLDRALELIGRNIEDAKSGQHTRIVANSLELLAQVHLIRGEYDQSTNDIAESNRLLSTDSSTDQLFVLKWQAVLQALRTSSVEPIQAFRAEALRRRHWESLRECDYYSLKLRFDPETYAHLLFGTPYASYRARAQETFKHSFRSDSTYQLGSIEGPRFDLITGEFAGLSGHLQMMKPGSQLHVLMGALLADFYKPVSLGALFASVFPGEHFNVHSSPNRIHKLLSRARGWIKNNEFPLAIEEIGSNYRLILEGPFSVAVPFERAEIDRKVVLWRKLRENFQQADAFSCSEAAAVLGISRSAFQKLASWAQKKGHLDRVRAGSATIYRLVS